MCKAPSWRLEPLHPTSIYTCKVTTAPSAQWILLENIYKLMWQLIWYVNINNPLNIFFELLFVMMIHLCNTHVLKFIIFLTSFIQILVYYLLEMSLITFIITSFVSFFSKICYNFSIFFQNKKSILKNKKNGFCF